MKKIFILLLLAAPCFAKGPKYNQKDPLLQDEIENIYKDIGNVLKGDVRISSVTITSLQGRGTSGNVCATCIGYYVSSATATSIPAVGSTVAFDLLTIFITPGTWAVSVGLDINAAGATVAETIFGVSTTSGNSLTGLTVGDNRFDASNPVTGGSAGFGAMSGYIVSLSAGTSHYFKIDPAYTVATPNLRGRITAVRIQ